MWKPVGCFLSHASLSSNASSFKHRHPDPLSSPFLPLKILKPIRKRTQDLLRRLLPRRVSCVGDDGEFRLSRSEESKAKKEAGRETRQFCSKRGGKKIERFRSGTDLGEDLLQSVGCGCWADDLKKRRRRGGEEGSEREGETTRGREGEGGGKNGRTSYRP